MKQATVDFQFTTPALLGGANQAHAEMRMPSVRGALRWWSRVMEYPVNSVFGYVSGKEAQASSIILRDLSNYPLRDEFDNAEKLTGSKSDYFMWPLGRNGRGVLPARTRCKFKISTRRTAELDERVLKTFLLLGCLGSRSRRAYGSIWPLNVEIDGQRWQIPTTIEEFKKELKRNVSLKSYCVVMQIDDPQPDERKAIKCCADFLKTFRCGSSKSGTPRKWGKNDHDVIKGTVSEIYRPVLGLPLTQRYSSDTILQTEIPGVERLASPVHFKVLPLKEGKVPIATIFTNLPDCINENKAIQIKDRGRCIASPLLSFELLEELTYVNEENEYWSNAKLLGEFYDK